MSARRWSRSFVAARPSAAGFGSGATSSIAVRACAVRGIPAAPSSPSSVSMPLAPLAPVPLSPLLLPLAAAAASLSMLHRGCAWRACHAAGRGGPLSVMWLLGRCGIPSVCVVCHGFTMLGLVLAVRGSCSCAPVLRCTAERPVVLAWAAPASCARMRRLFPPVAFSGPPQAGECRRAPATATAAGAAVSPLGRCAPACVWPRAAAWRLPRGARGRRVAGLSPAPSHAATAVHHFLSGSPPVLPPVLSRVWRAALTSSDRAWVIRGRLCRSCHWISNPIGRRAPLPDHQRPPHGSL